MGWKMKTANSRNLRLPRLLAPAILLLVGAVGGPISEGRAFDTAMICAWKRTFYTYNYIHSPLRAYNMPRVTNCDCWGSQATGLGDCQVPVGFESAGFERLGRIPNDLGAGLGGVAAGPVPGR